MGPPFDLAQKTAISSTIGVNITLISQLFHTLLQLWCWHTEPHFNLAPRTACIWINLWVFFGLLLQVWWTTARCLATRSSSTGVFALCCTTSNSISGSSLKVNHFALLPINYIYISFVIADCLFMLEETTLESRWHKLSRSPLGKKQTTPSAINYLSHCN